MHVPFTTCSPGEFENALAALNGHIADAAEYRRLTTVTLATPAIKRLADLDPFSSEYHAAVLELYVQLRARHDDDYVVERDEAPSYSVPENIWTNLTPWDFRDAAMVGEHLYAWGHILRHLSVPPGGSVLEYGPGTGQLLLILARMGFRACGVDVDNVALESIRRQAEGMSLNIPTERALFGEGFDGERFDTIVFYEAFHHAINFQALLSRLHDRLKPGGRLILCGEPIVPEICPSIPYPWGPRLDALSVFYVRRFGWMELGFTHSFFCEAARRAGWRPSFHFFPGCGRAHVYVLVPSDTLQGEEVQEDTGVLLTSTTPAVELPASEPTLHRPIQDAGTAAEHALSAELQAIRASTSWRVTRPLRFFGKLLRKL